MDKSILGANLLVMIEFFPETLMLISAMVICMNVALKEVIYLPRRQYVSLLIVWAFLILETFHAVAVILSFDVWLLGILHLLQDVIQGDCLPGQGLICHLFFETARHLTTLLAASILVSVLALEDTIARSIVPETRQALEALEDWWDSEDSATLTPDPSTSLSHSILSNRSLSRNKVPRAQSAPRIKHTSKVLTSSKEQPGPSGGKPSPNASTCIEPRKSSLNETLAQSPSLVASIPNLEKPGSSDPNLIATSNTSMAARYHKGTIRKSSFMNDPIPIDKEQPPTALKIKPATKSSTKPRPKAARVSMSSKPPIVIRPSLSNEQAGFSGGKVKLTPGNPTALRQSAMKGARTGKPSGQADKLAQQKSGRVKKK